MVRQYLKYLFGFSALVLIAFSYNLSAKQNKNSTPAKKEYTDEEFKTAVLEEATKLMKKAGSSHLVGFSKELLEKEDAIKLKEIKLKKEEEQLAVAQEELKKKVIEFQDSQSKFLGCVEGVNAQANARVGHMVEVISGMRPQTAADLLTVQDADLAVKILGELESAKASKIFNLMDKEVSARLQKQFLQMKK